MTDDKDVRMAQSVMDAYIFRRLALDYLSFEERSALGIYTADERARELETGSYAPSGADESLDMESLSQGVPVVIVESVESTSEFPSSPQAAGPAAAVAPVGDLGVAGVHSSAELMERITGTASDAPMCMTCGVKMRPAGSCYVCDRMRRYGSGCS